MEDGVLGATLDIAHPPNITGFDLITAIKAPHISSFVAFYKVMQINSSLQSFTNDLLQTSGVWTNEVRYLVGSGAQSCYRDRGRNVVCNFLPRDWEDR